MTQVFDFYEVNISGCVCLSKVISQGNVCFQLCSTVSVCADFGLVQCSVSAKADIMFFIMGLLDSLTLYRRDARRLAAVCTWLRELLTDAGGHRRAALLVALGTAVAGDAGDAVLAGTLACGLVAGFARSSHRVAVTSWGGVQGQV